MHFMIHFKTLLLNKYYEILMGGWEGREGSEVGGNQGLKKCESKRSVEPGPWF